MSENFTLTPGAIAAIYQDLAIDGDADAQPILQVLSVKKITNPDANAVDRFRVILSDGTHFAQSMLATQHNNLVASGVIDRNAIIRLGGHASSWIQGRKLLIVLNAERLNTNPIPKIDSPTAVELSFPNIAAPSGAGGGAAPNNNNPNQSTSNNPNSAPAPAPAAAAAAGGSRGGFGSGQGVAGRGGAGGAGSGPTRGGRGGARGGGMGGGGPGGRGNGVGPLYPIEGLSPYQNKWTIKARVVNRSEIKHWSNARGEGKLFSVTLMDESGEIRATGFNDAVDNFYEMLQEGKVFFISQARVNIAKKQFSNVNNEYEIMFERNTEVTPCEDDNIPQIQYKFVPLAELGDVQKDQTVDVIAVVKEVGPIGSINSKATQKPFAKRDLTLVDITQWSVRLTLWGKQAENFTQEDMPVVAFKGVKVGDFGGRSLSMFSGSTMSINPDIEQAHALKGWYDAEGETVNYQQYSNSSMGITPGANGSSARTDELKTIGQVKDENLGTSDKMDFFSTKATINFVKHENFAYAACPTEKCNKKVVQDGEGYRCEKCDKLWEQPSYRYILNISVMDHSGHIWVTAFNEVGEELLGIKADDLQKIKEEAEEETLTGFFTKAQGKSFNFSCSAKQDTFNDQIRVRYSIRRAAAIDYKAEALNLARLIEAM